MGSLLGKVTVEKEVSNSDTISLLKTKENYGKTWIVLTDEEKERLKLVQINNQLFDVGLSPDLVEGMRNPKKVEF